MGFHSLPESKRYPDTDDEWAIVLDRYNTVLDELFADLDVYVATSDWSGTPVPPERPHEQTQRLPGATRPGSSPTAHPKSPKHDASDTTYPTASPRSTPTSHPKSNNDSSTTSNAAGTKPKQPSKHTHRRRNRPHDDSPVPLPHNQHSDPHPVGKRDTASPQATNPETDHPGENRSRTSPPQQHKTIKR